MPVDARLAGGRLTLNPGCTPVRAASDCGSRGCCSIRPALDLCPDRPRAGPDRRRHRRRRRANRRRSGCGVGSGPAAGARRAGRADRPGRPRVRDRGPAHPHRCTRSRDPARLRGTSTARRGRRSGRHASPAAAAQIANVPLRLARRRATGGSRTACSTRRRAGRQRHRGARRGSSRCAARGVPLALADNAIAATGTLHRADHRHEGRRRRDRPRARHRARRRRPHASAGLTFARRASSPSC